MLFCGGEKVPGIFNDESLLIYFIHSFWNCSLWEGDCTDIVLQEVEITLLILLAGHDIKFLPVVYGELHLNR